MWINAIASLAVLSGDSGWCRSFDYLSQHMKWLGAKPVRLSIPFDLNFMCVLSGQKKASLG
jgi:hypothetical protein